MDAKVTTKYEKVLHATFTKEEVETLINALASLGGPAATRKTEMIRIELKALYQEEM